jgi:hypothetical protein
VSEVPWTEEARRRVATAPPFVRPGILKLMQVRARERGRTAITSEFLTEIRNESMLRVAKCIRGFGFEELSMAAFEVARAKMRKLPRKTAVIDEIRAFLDARVEKNQMILDKFRRYLESIPERGLPWMEEALARIERAPAAVREIAREAALERARQRREPVVTPEAVQEATDLMARAVGGAGEGPGGAAEPVEGMTLPWDLAARERLRRIPIPAVRALVVRRIEESARARGQSVVDLAAWEAAAPAPPPAAGLQRTGRPEGG